MRALGLDLGTKTVGVALSDELGITAQALVTYRRTGAKADLQGLLGLIVEHGVTGLVVGLPLHMNGEEGDRAREHHARVRHLDKERDQEDDDQQRLHRHPCEPDDQPLRP